MIPVENRSAKSWTKSNANGGLDDEEKNQDHAEHV